MRGKSVGSQAWQKVDVSILQVQDDVDDVITTENAGRAGVFSDIRH